VARAHELIDATAREGRNGMISRFALMTFAALAIAACETTSEEAATTGRGGAGGAGDTSGVSTLPPPSSSGVTSMSTSPITRGNLGPAEVERELVSTGDTVYFAFDSYSLDGPAQTTLDRQAALLLKNTATNLTIEGHTDERGTREYNLALGERRATAVKDYLVAFGINPGRVRTLSYGEERPAVVGSSETAWAKNRRGVTVVVGGMAGS
jgi:peptidoglycan-associated lipoprotein